MGESSVLRSSPISHDPSLTTEETIAAIATPLGPGGLGVVRVSGPGALAAADRVFRGAAPLAAALSHTLHHGLIHDAGNPLDDAVAAVFRAPRSYTGEDVVEFSCHGSPDLLRRVLDLCLSRGVRAAGPGEFTQRAFLNGKMDLAQAEAVALLVSARSEDARKWSLDQLRGGLSRRLADLRRGVLGLLAQVEAGLDFAEEEVPDLSREELRRGAGDLGASLSRLLDTAPRGRIFRDGLQAVLAGRPNVGKSSLFNALLGHDRAIVTDVAGTTRDTLQEFFEADGLPAALTDTAGLRATAEPVESQGVARARKALETADAVLWVVDAENPFTEEDITVLRSFPPAANVLAVLNKADRVPVRDRAPLLERALRAAPGRTAVLTSALTGEGLADLRQGLARSVLARNAAARDAGDGPTLLNDRHVALAREAAQSLGAAAEAARAGEPGECAALELRRALDALDRITGRGVPDEVLHEIFSRFCIGK